MSNHYKRFTIEHLPGRSGKTSEDQSFLVIVHFGHVGRLHTLSNPVTLFKRVDEHEFDTDVVAVCLLQTVQDLSEIKIIILYNFYLFKVR